MPKGIVPVVVFGLLVAGGFSVVGSADVTQPELNSSPVNGPTYTPHATIRINNDTDFNNQFSNRTIWGLEIDGSGKGICIYIGNCSVAFTVQNCYLHNASMKTGFPYFRNVGCYIYNTSSGIIKSCMINFNEYGVYDEASSGNTVTKNNMAGNTYDGIHTDNADSCSISHNNIIKSRTGINILYGSTDNVVIGNRLNGNINYGMEVGSYSHRTLISNNTIDRNNAGVYLRASNNNVVSYNNITNNSLYGVEVGSIAHPGSNNVVHHNNLFGNNPTGRQAVDYTTSTLWNTSTGGNYWSDWASPDNNTDGFVDIPYFVEGGTGMCDHLPLAIVVPVPESSHMLFVIFIPIIVTIVVSVKRKVILDDMLWRGSQGI